MKTKLTLRMEKGLVKSAKAEARRRGKSVSRIVAEFFESLGRRRETESPLPPVTSSLFGILKGHDVSEEDYRRHLREKHL